jgi:5'/3'-nucleotidase SurE
MTESTLGKRRDTGPTLCDSSTSSITLAVALCISLAAPTASAESAAAGDAIASGRGTPASAAICGSGPLEILLTNDDGYQAPGIRALYDALRRAGHHVRLAAPAANASGSSVSFTWGGVSVVRDPADANVAGIAATPATAVVLGATALYPHGQRPDLVVSGINDGENTGSLLAMSGTVGAALAGTMLLDPPIPGIAVNAERAATRDAQAALPADRLERIARHLAQLIGGTRSWFCEEASLARPTLVLNVNYPALPMTAIRGVVVARQGRTTDLHLEFESTGAGTYDSRRRLQSMTDDYPDSDVKLLAAGYVTVTPISAALGVPSVPAEDLKRRLDATKFQ